MSRGWPWPLTSRRPCGGIARDSNRRTMDSDKTWPAWRSTGRAPTLVDYGATRLEALSLAAGFAAERDSIVRTFRDILGPWGEARLDQPPLWASDISDDNTPFELSVAIADGRPIEVRVLFEPQADEPTIK